MKRKIKVDIDLSSEAIEELRKSNNLTIADLNRRIGKSVKKVN